MSAAPVAGAARAAGAAAPRASGATRASRPVGAPRPPSRGRLALVPPLHAEAPRAPFVVLVAMLLVSGLAGLLFLHTALAEDSFRLHDLQVRSALLDDEEQALDQSLALEASPHRLAESAQRLGMVRSENPAFIRLTDGRILGKPKAGVAPPPPTPTADPSASAESDAGNDQEQDGQGDQQEAGATPSPGTTD